MKRYAPFQIAPLVLPLLFVLAGTSHAAGSGYTFSINGKPIQPVHYSLNGDPSVFAPGDVIYLGDKEFDYGGLYMTLGEERDCRFIAASTRTREPNAPWDSRVFLELPDGRRKIVGLTVTWNTRAEPVDSNGKTPGKNPGAEKEPSDDRIPYNPLDSLSPEEIHGLWGIEFVQWPQGVEQKLAQVDANRVCLAINGGAGVGGSQPPSLWGGGGPLFPPIPPKTRYLIVEKRDSGGLSEFSRLSQFHDLVFLKVALFADKPLDVGLICQNTSMRYLDLSGCDVSNYPKLAALTDLRFLNISGCGEFVDIEFVKGMRQLRALWLGRTRVTSLSPLDGSDSIRDIYAGMTNVSVLPKGELRSLQTINLVSSRVNAQAVEQFRKDHPACIIQYGWVDSLQKALQGTTRLRIRSGGTCHRVIGQEKTLAEITEAAEINRFLRGIGIDESRSRGVCGCCGNPTFEFYAGDRLLAMVGYHHGERLRWAGGKWTADGELTSASQDFLITWLSQHGVDGPRQARDQEQKQRTEKQREEDRYAELVGRQTLAAVAEAYREISRSSSPREETRLRVEKQLKAQAEVFEKYEKDTRTSVEKYLRFLGVRNNAAWDAYWENEAVVAMKLLPRFKGPELAEAALEVMKDEEGMAGAARWFLGERGWRNLDASDRERILPPLARRALQHRHATTRKRAMAALSEINSVWAAELLRGTLSRPTDPNWTRPKTKPSYGHKIDLATGEQVYEDECSDAVWAAFCLARMGNSESLAAIQKLADEYQGPDKDLLDKAVQLLHKNAGTVPGGSQ